VNGQQARPWDRAPHWLIAWSRAIRSGASAVTRKATPKRMILANLNRRISSKSVDPELRIMLDHFERRQLYRRTSRMWIHLMALHVDRLLQHGCADFYHHLGKNYCLRFTDLEKVSPDILRPLNGLNIAATSLLQRQRNMSLSQSVMYNLVALAMLKYYETTGDPARLDGLRRLDPNFRQNAFIADGRVVSQDELQSLFEIGSMEAKVGFEGAAVLEVGAGYGRIPYALMSEGRIRKYVVVDIPPALYVSQYFLSTVFPDRKTFRFRPFDDYTAVKDEFENSDLAFVMPDQMDLLPPKSIDIVVAINCFQEMIDTEVMQYFDNFDRLARYLYLKASETPHNVYAERFLPLRRYPFKPGWECLARSSCLVPLDYSETLFRL
jgi:hypothetical protein